MKVFNSFEELGEEFGIPAKKRKSRPFVCRKCGAVMQHIKGTNVFLCYGVLKDGKECGNKVFTKAIT